MSTTFGGISFFTVRKIYLLIAWHISRPIFRAHVIYGVSLPSLVLNSGLGRGREEQGVWKPAISITHLITIGEKRWREWRMRESWRGWRRVLISRPSGCWMRVTSEEPGRMEEWNGRKALWLPKSRLFNSPPPSSKSKTWEIHSVRPCQRRSSNSINVAGPKKVFNLSRRSSEHERPRLRQRRRRRNNLNNYAGGIF